MDRSQLLHTYEQMVLLRQFELAVQSHFKRGDLPGFIHLYVGQEAVAVGVCAHLSPQDWITSTHRGHGHALAKGLAPRAVMAELFGKATGCCGGRGGSMHLYDPKSGVFGTNGIVAAGIPHAVGAALSARTRGTEHIAVAFFGDGAIQHGAFHESMNFAAAQRAGVLFVCENNLYATATPLHAITRNPDIASKAAAYGMPGVTVDGNDVLAVEAVAREAIARARAGEGPTLIEAKTYRVVGHHEGEPLVGTYRTREELDAWKQRCPIQGFRRRLIESGEANAAALDEIDTRVAATVTDAVHFAQESPEPDAATVFVHGGAEATPLSESPVAPSTATQGWLDAVRDGIAEEMRRDPFILYFGEGTGERGGSFAHTRGLWQEFGSARLIDTAICELGFTGAAIGASATGCRTIADLMFADFIFETGGQIPLQASKLRYISNGTMSAPVVVRAACGALKSAGPHHSGTYHPIWAHLPGVLVAMPSTPADAKGLMKAALRGQAPVLFLEPKALFASKGEVPQGEHVVPFGVARTVRAGHHLTVVTVGRMVPLVMEAAGTLDQEGIQCEVIDLRTIVPLDLETIVSSLRKTRRLLVIDEGYPMCGIGAEIAASVSELAFDCLDAPVGRVHTEPVPHPFSPSLERLVLPTAAKIIAAVRATLRGRPSPPRRLDATPQREARLVTPPPSTGASMPTPSAVVPTAATAPAHAAPGAAQDFITMPHGDLTVSEGKVVQWLKQAGETFAAGEIVAELETDKALLEIEAPAAGRLSEILAPVGTTVSMGGALATFVKL
ncbi:MAG TPA: thiamine pyrophosphate-dependent enzyme [Steroidobacteraceae bacterium]|jgi:2-oxoisovalerate dehydrogenase E1 component